MNDTKAILQIENLRTSFGTEGEGFTAVNGINFELFEGEILGIVGESGSGKSVTTLSLLRLLSSKNTKIEGKALFENDDLLNLTEEELRKVRGGKISMIFQEPMSSLNPTMKLGLQVREMLDLHTDLSKEDAKKEVLQLFEKVQLPDPERLYNAFPHQASGGQLQRVMIAMAVSTNPKVLIADEPTTALDVTVQKEIIALLKEVQKQFNTATIFISHDLHLIRNICDRVMVMKDGSLIESGPVQQIFFRPKENYTKALIASRPSQNFHLSRLPTVEDFEAGVKPMERSQRKIVSDRVIFECSGLKKYFPAKTDWLGRVKTYTKAVDDVNLKLHKGEILGLVGESGCGKSTLGRLFSKLIEPDDGSIIFEGQDITTLKKDALRKFRRTVQMIFQDPYSSLNPRMKIGEAILEPILAHGLMNKSQGKERVAELLTKTGLEPEHFDRFPHEFSGGQRQRISIARALSVEPKVLICDECIAALDVSVQAQIVNLLLDLNEKEGLSMLFIAHDLDVVRFISDNLAVMLNGKIVEYGDAKSVYESPSKDYTKKLLEASI